MTKAQRKIAVDHLLDGARGRRINAACYRSLAMGGGLGTNYLVDGILDTERRPGRPPIDEIDRETIMVGGRLPAGVEARVRARATADGVSVSDVVRSAIEAYI